jgi:putative flippase GtrA
MRALLAQFVRFGLVGAVGLVIDVGVFNLLRITVLAPEAVQHGPIYAKLISTSLAILANWLGNRYWTFGAARRPQLVREGFEFAIVSVGGMVIGLACLWVSHYALGFTSLLADNLSSNVVGLALGTAFRFWLYRTWVRGGADWVGAVRVGAVRVGRGPGTATRPRATGPDQGSCGRPESISAQQVTRPDPGRGRDTPSTR